MIDICLQFIKMSDMERDTFTECLDEFVAIGQDTCERQESETQKTLAAQLLESMCEHVDGCLTFIVNVVCQALTASFSGQGVNNAM